MSQTSSNCTVFSYSKKGERWHLYVRGISAQAALAVFSPCLAASVVRFGATNYKNYGWATEENIPSLESVQAIRLFLEESELGLIDFELCINSCHTLFSDDLESRFCFHSEADLIRAIQVLVPIWHGRVINMLFQHPESYIVCDDLGQTKVSPTLEYFTLE